MTETISSAELIEFLKGNTGTCQRCLNVYRNLIATDGDLKVAIHRYNRWPDSSNAKTSFETARDAVKKQKDDGRHHMQYDH